MLPKRIAIIAGTLGQGGAERQLVYILQALKSLGVQATVYALTNGEYFEGPVQDTGAELVHIDARGRVGRFLEIARRVKRQSPDAVMSMHFFTNLYAYTAAQYSAVPSIGALRNDCISEMRGVGKLGRTSLLAPTAMVANSMAALRSAIDAGRNPRSVHYLGNVVDSDRFAPAPQAPDRAVPLLLFVGRLEPQKRVDRLLRLLQRVSAKRTIECHLYGSGSLEQELQRMAEGMDFGDSRVAFKGLAADTAPLYRSADVLLLTSDHEGTPNVVLEAQSSGLPVVTTASGGTPDLVRHRETGMLVPIEDEDALFAATMELLNDDALAARIRRNARAHIEQTYSVASLAGNLTRIFESVSTS